MKIIAWCFVLASAPFFIYYLYLFIQPNLIDADIRAIKMIRHDVRENLTQIDLPDLLAKTEDCDRFIPITGEYPILGPIVPRREKAFFIKLCEPSSVDFTRIPILEESDILGILGVTPLRDDPTNTADSPTVITYEPTNGTYSRGDLLFFLYRDKDGTIQVWN